MSLNIKLKHSAVADKKPQVADLQPGELALNINNASPAGYALDDAGAVQQMFGKATETQEGQAEIATQSEVDAGTDDERIVTPATLNQRIVDERTANDSKFVEAAGDHMTGALGIGGTAGAPNISLDPGGVLALAETTLSNDKLTLSADSAGSRIVGQTGAATIGFTEGLSSYGMLVSVPSGLAPKSDNFYNYYANLSATEAGTATQAGFVASSLNDAGVPVAGFKSAGTWSSQSGGGRGIDLNVDKNTTGSTNYNIYVGDDVLTAESSRCFFGSDVVFGKDPQASTPGYGNALLGFQYRFSDGTMYLSNNAPAFRLHRTTNGDVIEFRQGGQASSSGKITVTGLTTAYSQSSDYRLKENIVPIGGATGRFKLLKPSRFNYKIEPSVVVDGFIAHEVQEIVPEAVTGLKDAVDENGEIDPQGIDQSKLVPLITAALQEALARIEALEEKV